MRAPSSDACARRRRFALGIHCCSRVHDRSGLLPARRPGIAAAASHARARPTLRVATLALRRLGPGSVGSRHHGFDARGTCARRCLRQRRAPAGPVGDGDEPPRDARRAAPGAQRHPHREAAASPTVGDMSCNQSDAKTPRGFDPGAGRERDVRRRRQRAVRSRSHAVFVPSVACRCSTAPLSPRRAIGFRVRCSEHFARFEPCVGDGPRPHHGSDPRLRRSWMAVHVPPHRVRHARSRTPMTASRFDRVTRHGGPGSRSRAGPGEPLACVHPDGAWAGRSSTYRSSSAKTSTLTPAA